LSGSEFQTVGPATEKARRLTGSG